MKLRRERGQAVMGTAQVSRMMMMLRDLMGLQAAGRVSSSGVEQAVVPEAWVNGAMQRSATSPSSRWAQSVVQDVCAHLHVLQHPQLSALGRALPHNKCLSWQQWAAVLVQPVLAVARLLQYSSCALLHPACVLAAPPCHLAVCWALLCLQVWSILSAQAELLGVLESEGQELLVAAGGRGGRGNAVAPSNHQRPASRARSDGHLGQEVGPCAAVVSTRLGPFLRPADCVWPAGNTCAASCASQLATRVRHHVPASCTRQD